VDSFFVQAVQILCETVRNHVVRNHVVRNHVVRNHVNVCMIAQRRPVSLAVIGGIDCLGVAYVNLTLPVWDVPWAVLQ